MKCPYCGWGVVDNQCVRCNAEVKVKEEEKPVKIKKVKEK